MRRFFLLLLVCLFAVFIGAATPRFAAAQALGDDLFGGGATSEPVTVHAVAESDSVVQGTTSHVALKITIAQPYHIQSAQPLDASLIALKTVVTTSQGITASEILLPPAQIIDSPPGLSATPKMSVYENTMTLLVPIKIAADAPIGTGKVMIAVTSQACATDCFPPKTEKFSIPVTIVAAGSAVTPGSDQKTFADALKANTLSLPAGAPAPTAVTATTTPAAAVAMSDADQLKLINDRNYRAANSGDTKYSLPLIMLFALLGGIILNVMPCVLPVIPLKVLSIVQQAHGDRSKALMHSLAFSAGIISLFMVLAILLKSFGLFYGQQFQSPGFLIGIALFIVAFSLSMLNVWTIQTPQAAYNMEGKAHGYAGSFMSGLAATLLATPCSAPYLGPVLAWALVQHWAITALALGLVGVGMALPYVVLAMMPKVLDKLPRAGRWTEVLKQGLGIVMLGVAIYLITLIPNAALWPWVLFAAILVAIVCWGWGQIPSPVASPSAMWSIRIGVLIVGIALAFGLYSIAQKTLKPSSVGEWQPFTVASLDAALKEGRPVVVDWTADWCINCRSLEALVLSTPEVKKAFEEHRITLLKADLSSDNPPASAMNQKLGGQAIPALAIFSPAKPEEPVVLRDLYTQKKLLSELDRLN